MRAGRAQDSAGTLGSPGLCCADSFVVQVLLSAPGKPSEPVGALKATQVQAAPVLPHSSGPLGLQARLESPLRPLPPESETVLSSSPASWALSANR